MGPAPEVVSKSEFARHLGVTPACVSRWIARGYIGGEALAGVGSRAKIVRSVAHAQLVKHFATARSNKFSAIVTFARRVAGKPD